MKIIDYKGPKTGEVIELYKRGSWCKVKWHNGQIETLSLIAKEVIFRGQKRFRIIAK
jgi:hypothetical protein